MPSKPKPQKDAVGEIVKAIRAMRAKYMRETKRLDADKYPMSHNYNQGAAYALKQVLKAIADHAPARRTK